MRHLPIDTRGAANNGFRGHMWCRVVPIQRDCKESGTLADRGPESTVSTRLQSISSDRSGVPSPNLRKAARCQPIRVAGLTVTKALRHSKKQAHLENTKRSAEVVGLGFFYAPEREPATYARRDFSGPGLRGSDGPEPAIESPLAGMWNRRCAFKSVKGMDDLFTERAVKHTFNRSEGGHSWPKLADLSLEVCALVVPRLTAKRPYVSANSIRNAQSCL